jgi:hypothetical protein
VLIKDPAIRVSPDWSANLTQAQIEYAALDVWASLQIYLALESLAVPSPLNFTLPSEQIVGKEVFLYHDDRTTIIASGKVSPKSQFTSYHGISITSTRTVVEVERVYVPGAIMTVHKKQSLDEFGPTPFDVICRKTHVMSYVAEYTPNLPTLPPSNPASTTASPSSVDLDSPDPEFPSGDLTNLNIQFSDDNAISWKEVGEGNQNNQGEVDQISEQVFSKILDDISLLPWPPEVRSGVLKDIFHVFHMIYIPRSHGLRVTFARTLRDAIFVPDPEDKRQIESYLARLEPPMTWKQGLQTRPRFIKQHCKFVVPPPGKLFSIVEGVFKVYGPIKDSKTGAPLFNGNAWKTTKSILEYIKMGYISDPPNVALYYRIGVCSKSGLPVYRCSRGTNFTEGGVHRPIWRCMPVSGVSPQHASNRLKDWVFAHNMRTGTYNTTGQPYRGHYDLQLINDRQELLNSEIIRNVIPQSQCVSGWVNGNLYVPTTEVFGILPIPEDVRIKHGLLAYDDISPPSQYAYLAQKQNTKYAVLTVHTPVEKDLFSDLMQENPAFLTSKGIDLDRAPGQWNERANGNGIFYKVS